MAFGVKEILGVELPVAAPVVAKAKVNRPELGAIWNKKGKVSDFYSIKLKFTEEQLKKILSSPKDEKGRINVNYVAFNNNRKEKENQPDILIYEDQSNQ